MVVKFLHLVLAGVAVGVVGCGPPVGLVFDPVALGLEEGEVEWGGGVVRSYGSGGGEVGGRIDQGGRMTVIFVHGSPGSAGGWSRFLGDEELGEAYDLVAYDRPGYGESGGGRWRGLGDQVEALVALIDEQEGRVILVGHSLGGAVVLGASAERGGKVARTVVLAGSVDPGLGPTRPLNAFLKFSQLQYVLPERLRVSNEEVHALRGGLGELAGRLGEIRTPVTVVQGRRDWLVPYKNVSYLEGALRGVVPRVILLEEEGHFLPWRQFDLVKGVLLGEG